MILFCPLAVYGLSVSHIVIKLISDMLSTLPLLMKKNADLRLSIDHSELW